jgi:hypothetical protein
MWLAQGFGIAPGLQPGVGAEHLHSVHRRMAGADYYFVNNATSERVAAPLYFADDGRDPEVWDLSTGEVAAARFESIDDRLAVAIDLAPGTATVIGFERTVGSRGAATEVASVEIGPWSLTATASEFLGDPVSIDREAEPLADWRDIPELQHFSGTGRYRATVDLPASFFDAATRITLDLGEVYDVAEVTVNGVAVATLSGRPYEVDVSSRVVPGSNSFEIVVTTTLRNLFVGFALQGLQYYFPLLLAPDLSPAGLVGPVRLVGSMSGDGSLRAVAGRNGRPMVASPQTMRRSTQRSERRPNAPLRGASATERRFGTGDTRAAARGGRGSGS